MRSWAQRLSVWATGELSKRDLIFLADRTGAVESWLRAQAMLAGESGALGRGPVRAEREGNVDLLVGENAAEFKVVWNNKNFLRQVAGVRGDWQKLSSRDGGQGALVVFTLFYDKREHEKLSTFPRRTKEIALQPLNDQDFGPFARELGELFAALVVPNGLRASPLRQLVSEQGRWFGVWVQPVRRPST